ncbi:MAG: YfhO family protein [Clostridia bacterium]
MNIKSYVRKNKKELIFISIAILVSLFACIPYINRLSITGHDLSYHLNRILGISEALKSGSYINIINYSDYIVSGMGYANAIFYPEIFLYVPAILNALGIGLISSYKLFILCITFLTTISMYICTKKIFKSIGAAGISSLLYVFSVYRLTDVFVRCALGEILAFLFIPIVILGLYEIIYGEKEKWWILALGITGVANSHMISFVLVIGTIFFFLVINILKIYREKGRLKYIIICGFVSIALCSTTFLPMIEQLASAKYNLTEEATGIKLEIKAVVGTKIFENAVHKGQAENDYKELSNKMTMGIGTILLIIPCCIIFCNNKSKKRDEIRTFAFQLIMLGFILVFVSSEFFPWKYFQIFKLIQFPWRLNLISTALLCMASAYVLSNVTKYKQEAYIFSGIMIIFFAGIQLENIDCIVNPDNYTAVNMLTGAPIGNGEYLPYNFKNEKKELISNDGVNILYPHVKDIKCIKFDYNEDNKSNNGEVIVPYTYYKGYNAYIYTKEGKKKLKIVGSDEGTLKLINENQLFGSVVVKYELTKIQILSYTISGIAFIFVISYIVRKKHNN